MTAEISNQTYLEPHLLAQYLEHRDAFLDAAVAWCTCGEAPRFDMDEGPWLIQEVDRRIMEEIESRRAERLAAEQAANDTTETQGDLLDGAS